MDSSLQSGPSHSESSEIAGRSTHSQSVTGLDKGLQFAGLLLCLLMAATVLERFNPLIDPLVQFRLQLMWLLLLVGFSLLARHASMAGTAIGLICWVFAAPTLNGLIWFYVPQSNQMSGNSSATPYRLMLLNLYNQNHDIDSVRLLVQEVDPDIICFIEVEGQWRRGLQPLEKQFPYTASDVRFWGNGVKLFSKYPLTTKESVSVDHAPLVHTMVALPDQQLTIVATHPFSPTNNRRVLQRNKQISQIASIVEQLSGPLITVGDFNCTTWSRHLEQFQRRTGLTDSRKGFGIQPSWPSWKFCFPFRITIDHIFVSNEITVAERRIGRFCGSDHFPVILDFSIR